MPRSIYRGRRGEAALRALDDAALERLGGTHESRTVGTRLGDTQVLAIGPADDLFFPGAAVAARAREVIPNLTRVAVLAGRIMPSGPASACRR